MTEIERRLSKEKFREYTMGCFYQDELRKHDKELREYVIKARIEELEQFKNRNFGSYFFSKFNERIEELKKGVE